MNYQENIFKICDYFGKEIPQSLKFTIDVFDHFEPVHLTGYDSLHFSQTGHSIDSTFYHPDFPNNIDEASLFLSNVLSSIRGCLRCLFMEPLYAGQLNFSQKSILETYFLATAGSDYYVDNVLIPEIRELFPAGELLYTEGFLVSRAFAKTRLDKKQRLAYYIDRYQRKSKVSTSFDQSFDTHYRVLQKRKEIRLCLVANKKFFKNFYQRFFSVKNLPSLCSQKTHPEKSSHFNNYIENLIFDSFKGTSKLGSQNSKLVSLRRAIQLRAYFASKLKFILSENRHTFSKKKGCSLIEDKLAEYLDELELLLNSLLPSNPIRSPKSSLEELDEFYEKKVRSQLKKNDFFLLKKDFMESGEFSKKKAVLSTLQKLPLDYEAFSKDLAKVFLLLENLNSNKIDIHEYLEQISQFDFCAYDLSFNSPITMTFQDIEL